MIATGKQEERKAVRLEPLAKKNEKPYVSNPTLSQKKRNAMPEED